MALSHYGNGGFGRGHQVNNEAQGAANPAPDGSHNDAPEKQIKYGVT